ncbi:MAG: DUF433 domain-containing protein [Anaerolineales bacterium]|nr:DUF433 domain-containing protein [Anaerolineales bacterium]
MNKEKMQKHIEVDPDVMVGKPVIKGTRLSVEYVLGLLAQGATHDEIIKEYPGVTEEDIQACLLFATKSLEDTDFMPLIKKAA